MKTKHKGRIDHNDTWEGIRDRWVETYRNREVHAGESATQKVSASNEWCAEAYIETDYSSLTKESFEQDIKKFLLFNLMLDIQGGSADEEACDETE